MRKFKCVITRIDEYEIEFDENIINDEWIKEYKQTFYPFDNLADHAEHISQHRARFQEDFIEGYGVPLVNGKIPYGADPQDVEKGINIRIISEDDDCDIEVTEL